MKQFPSGKKASPLRAKAIAQKLRFHIRRPRRFSRVGFVSTGWLDFIRAERSHVCFGERSRPEQSLECVQPNSDSICRAKRGRTNSSCCKSAFHIPSARPFSFEIQQPTRSEDDQIFSGIADVQITLTQQVEMPWIRATSAPLNDLKQSSARADGIPTEDLAIAVPAIFAAASAAIEIDFIRLEDVRPGLDGPTWEIAWHGFAIRISLKSVGPQMATLSWFHSS
jgi:hypothetical protein